MGLKENSSQEVALVSWLLDVPWSDVYCPCDPDYKGEIRLIFHNGGKGECVWNTHNPSVHLLVLPVIKVNGKLQPNPRWTSDGPGPLGMKVWVILPG